MNSATISGDMETLGWAHFETPRFNMQDLHGPAAAVGQEAAELALDTATWPGTPSRIVDRRIVGHTVAGEAPIGIPEFELVVSNGVTRVSVELTNYVGARSVDHEKADELEKLSDMVRDIGTSTLRTLGVTSY